MGTADHPVGEVYHKVNDGEYHVIRFTRNGANSTIQVDNYKPQPKHPDGECKQIFSNTFQEQHR